MAVRRSDSCVARPKRAGHALRVLLFLEAPPGIGPGIRVLQTRALPLGHGAVFSSERERAVLPRSVSPPKKCGQGSLLHHLSERKTGTKIVPVNGADYGARTRHLHLGKVALYQMS